MLTGPFRKEEVPGLCYLSGQSPHAVQAGDKYNPAITVFQAL